MHIHYHEFVLDFFMSLKKSDLDEEVVFSCYSELVLVFSSSAKLHYKMYTNILIYHFNRYVYMFQPSGIALPPVNEQVNFSFSTSE